MFIDFLLEQLWIVSTAIPRLVLLRNSILQKAVQGVRSWNGEKAVNLQFEERFELGSHRNQSCVGNEVVKASAGQFSDCFCGPLFHEQTNEQSCSDQTEGRFGAGETHFDRVGIH